MFEDTAIFCEFGPIISVNQCWSQQDGLDAPVFGGDLGENFEL